MSRLIKKNINIIAIATIGILIVGQDLYIFSILGPEIDLRTGPDGIREAQQFSNARNTVTTIITHGLLLGIVFLLILQPRYNTVITTPDNEDEANRYTK